MVFQGEFYVPQDWVQWAQILGLGVVAFAGQWCNSRSLQLEKAAIVASMGYLQVPFATLFDIAFFDYSLNILTTTGVILICSLSFVNLSKHWMFSKEGPSVWSRLRLWFMNRSTRHQMLPQEEELEEEKKETKEAVAVV